MTSQIILRRLLLLGAPLALGILELFHPVVSGSNLYAEIAPQVQTWLIVHLIQLPLAGLVALAVLMLTKDMTGVAVQASRVGVWVFLIFFSALDSLTGIGSGLAVEFARGLPMEQQQTIALLINEFHFSPIAFIIGRLAMLGWIISVTCAALALAQRNAPRLCVAFLALSLIFAIHVPPTGPLGLLLLSIAMVCIEFCDDSTSNGNATF